jgi:hypothetical protein
MEIGPVSGIRAVQPVQADRTARDLSGVFRVEFQREQAQDSYSPRREGSDRGIEDDEDQAEDGDEIAEAEALQVAEQAEHGGENLISLIA